MNFKVAFTLFVVATLCGCGAKNSSSVRGVYSENDPTVSYPSTSVAQGECTRIVTSGLSVAGQASTHYSYYGQADSDKILVNLTQVPAALLSDSNYSIKFYRWKELTDGNPQINSIATPFILKHKSLGTTFGTMSVINKDVMESIISDLGNTSIKVNNFFNNFYILLTNVDWQWQAVTIAAYQGTGDAVASADILLPPFYSNPNVYIQYTSSTRLETLHPLYNYRNSGGSENDYKLMTESICYEMMGGRTVASKQSLTEKIIMYFQQTWASVRGLLSDLFGL